MKSLLGILISLCLCALCFCAVAVAAAQEDVAAFYQGKQLRMVVGTGAGGGYDLFARAVARHIGNHIPGNPTVIVQNQAAAGGLVMVNQLYSLGPKDGTVMAAPINGIPTAPLLEPTAARFDAAKLNWIGSTNRETYVAYAWHTAGVHSLADLLQKELIVGATAAGTTLVDFPLVTNEFLGTESGSCVAMTARRKSMSRWSGARSRASAIGWRSVKTTIPQWIAEKNYGHAQYGLHGYLSWPTRHHARARQDRCRSSGPDHDVRATVWPALFRAARRAARARRSAAAGFRCHHE